MNLGQIRSRVRKVTGFTMPELYDNVDLDTLINEVYLDICGTDDWPFLYTDDTATVSAGAGEVTLPAGVRTFSSAQIAGSDQMVETTVEELDALDPNEEGEPELYARLTPERLLLWPTPEGSHTLRFRGWLEPAPLDDDTDAPLFEPEFHPVLVYETASRVLVEFGDFERVTAFRGQAADVLSRMKVRYLASKDRGLIQMGGRVRERRRWAAR